MNERSPMEELSDEILCAYIDGELDQETRGRIQESLTSDPAARARLERLQNADVNMRNAFPLPAANPNDPLIDYITQGTPRFAFRRNAVWGALAAGMSGIVLGFLLSKTTGGGDGPLLASAANDALSTALETQASGPAMTRGATSIEVQLTFRADDGRYCRVLRLQTDREGAEVIACREAGRWKVLALDATAADSGGFRTAGASELIDGVMDHLGGSAPLERKQEQSMIERHWQFDVGAPAN